MHVIAINLTYIQFPCTKLIPVVDNFQIALNLNVEISKDNLLNSKFILYSKKNGKKGKNLISLLVEKNNK